VAGFRIPLVNIPQTFDINLSNLPFKMKITWNDAMKSWMMALLDGNTQDVLIESMPLVTGADLLEQFAYLQIPGQLIVFTKGGVTDEPTFDNLGADSNLYYITEDV
jgi:hypothetical protein